MRFARVAFVFLLLSTGAAAQQYVISTYAGGGPPPTPIAAVNASFGGPLGVATDAAGNVYFSSLHCVFKLDSNGALTRVAGNSRPGYSGDGGPAINAQLFIRDYGYDDYSSSGPAIDSLGNVYIADSDNNRVRKVSPSGIITTVAGNGTGGFSGDGGPATSAQLGYPQGVAVDGAGNLFIADTYNFRIRMVSPSGIITTVAGNGTCFPGGCSGDGGAATSAQLGPPRGVAVDGAGNLFIADGQNNRIRRVSPDGIITTVAGNGIQGFSGDGGPAANAQLVYPLAMAADGAGNLFIADSYNYRIRKVSPDGIITTVAGDGTCCYSGDGGPATSAQLGASTVAVDGAGNLFVAGGSRIRKVSPSGIITTVAGNGTYGFSGDGGPATSAQLSASAVAVDGAGNLFIAGFLNNRIRKVSAGGIITTVAGNGTYGFSGDGGPATSAQLGASAVAVDGAGSLFIADTNNNRIRKVSPDGIITTVAGNGTPGFSGDGGPATSAQLRGPFGVAVDGAGNLFIADYGSERIRKVSPSGIITTVAGTGMFGYSGDGGFATTATLSGPSGVAVDGAGNVYVADTGNSAVRILRPTNQSVLIAVAAVVDAASQRADPVSPGKIVVLYGAGLGPSELIQNQPRNSQFGAELGGTAVSFNGIAAPILYTSATQVAAIVPYAITGATAQVTATYQGQASAAFTVPVAASAPGLFTLNQAGWGQAAAINAVDGTLNTAANPVKIGGYISLYATGEGQTDPGGLDGRIAGSTPARPVLRVSATVGGIPATIQYAGGAPGYVAGLMQVNVQIPSSVQPGGYVPVVLQVGARTSSPAVWIAVSAN